MAVTAQILNDGPRNHVVHLEIALANTAAVVVDASAWSGALTECKVTKAQWSLTGAAATLAWDATANVNFLECSAGDGWMNWEAEGGVINNAGAGVTGDVVLTNVAGLTEGTVTLWCKKR